MTDLHTHILPGMDDGAENAEMSLAMLRLEKAQRVQKVALTPHCILYREEPSEFLKRREAAWGILQKAMEQEKQSLPEILLGAEVTWQVSMPSARELERLCYQGTQYLLLELPMERWSPRLVGALYGLTRSTGLVPVIAHIDRYLAIQEKACIRDILAMDIPLQFSVSALSRFFSRRRSLRIMSSCQFPLLVSDCHNLTSRPPNLAEGMEICAAHLNRELITRLNSTSDFI